MEEKDGLFINGKQVDMDDILNTSFGELGSSIRVLFKKTVLVKQYETEVVEIDTSMDFGDKSMTGVERLYITSVLGVQTEYAAYSNLVFKGYITATEFNERKQELVGCINTVKKKAEELLQKPLDECFGLSESLNNK